MFLLENVDLEADSENLTLILKALSEAGFSCKTYKLISSDFAVPQRRVRIYILGFSNKRQPQIAFKNVDKMIDLFRLPCVDPVTRFTIHYNFKTSQVSLLFFFVAGTGHSWIHQTDSDSDKWQMTHYTDYTTHWQTHISHHWVTMPLRTSFSSMTMTLPWWKNWIDVDQFVLEQISPRSRRRIRRRTPLVTKVQPRRKRKTRANGKLHTKNWQRYVPRLIRSWFSVDFNFMSDWLQLHLVSYWVVDDNSMTDWYVLILILLYYIISKFPSVITHQHWCHIVLSPSQFSFGLCQILGGIQWPLTVPDELSKSEWFSTLNAREREANWVSFYFLTFHFNNFDFDLNFQFTGEWHVMILMWVT